MTDDDQRPPPPSPGPELEPVLDLELDADADADAAPPTNAGARFNPRRHAIRSQGNKLVGNFYTLDGSPDEATNPFTVLARLWGGRASLEPQIWSRAFTSAYKQGDLAFRGLLNGGLCSGFAAIVGQAWTETRFHRRPPLGQHRLESVMPRLVLGHMHVLTQDLMRYYKFFLANHPVEVLEVLRDWFAGPNPESIIVTFCPKLGFNFIARLGHAHAVTVIDATARRDGGLNLQVWDPNVPEQIRGPLAVEPNGDFRYQSFFGKECPISNADGRPLFEVDGSNAIPVDLKQMRMIPIPASRYFTPPSPFFDLWKVLTS